MRRPASAVHLSQVSREPKMSQPAVTLDPETSASWEIERVDALINSLKAAFTTANELYKRLKEFQVDVDEPKHSWRGSLYREDVESSNRHRGRHESRRSASRSRSRRNVKFGDAELLELREHKTAVTEAFEIGYERLGEKFAIGDLLAQSQLQSSMISVQKAVIAAFQTCCWVNKIKRNEIAHHLSQLHGATVASRHSAVRALRKLLERLAAGSDRSSTLPYPEADFNMNALVIRSRSPSRERSRAAGPHGSHEATAYHVFPHKAYAGRGPKVPNSIFCPYARDLQNDMHQPVSDDFKAEGDGRCPYCRFYIPIRPGGLWSFPVADGRGRRSPSQTTFEIGNRFIIKSHRDGGTYACVLCAKYRKEDTTCREVMSLVEHIRKDHTIGEIEGDIDIIEVV